MVTEIPREDWLRLYEAARKFHAAEVWNDMTDAQLFGVINPETEERGYCSVMGQGGDYYALGIYPGNMGFRSYKLVFTDDPEEDGSETMFKQRCLIVAFEHEDEVDADDKLLISSLGLSFGAGRSRFGKSKTTHGKTWRSSQIAG